MLLPLFVPFALSWSTTEGVPTLAVAVGAFKSPLVRLARLVILPNQNANANHQHAPLHVGTARNRYNEWWRFYPCIGNAVAVPLIKEVGLAIARTLELAGGSPEPHRFT